MEIDKVTYDQYLIEDIELLDLVERYMKQAFGAQKVAQVAILDNDNNVEFRLRDGGEYAVQILCISPDELEGP